MEFKDCETWEEANQIKEQIKISNELFLNVDKYELRGRGIISLNEYRKVCENINTYYSLENTELLTSDLILDDQCPDGNPSKIINKFILKNGIKKAVILGYIPKMKLKKYNQGYMTMKNRRGRIYKKKRSRIIPECTIQERQAIPKFEEYADEELLHCSERFENFLNN